MRRVLGAALVVLVGSAAVACSDPQEAAPPTAAPSATAPSSPEPSSPAPSPVPTDYDRPAVRFGDRVVSVEIADEPFETQRGLMFRTRLAPDAGMLFVFRVTKTSGFYMANTKIPLSIAYMRHLGRGRFEVVSIRDMDPCRLADPDDCPNYPPGAGYNTALEVNQGWFVRAGVEVGDVGVFEPAP